MTDEAALDALLEREPNNIAALVLKGQLRQQSRDDRAASAFYQAALRAAAAAQSLPASLRPVIERAQAGFAQCQASFDRHTEQALSAAGFPLGRRPPRFQELIDLMRGVRQTQLQLQRPTAYYFPGLPQRRYYERDDLPWVAQIEAATSTIKAELLDYLAKRDDAFPRIWSPIRRGLGANITAWSTIRIGARFTSFPKAAGSLKRRASFRRRSRRSNSWIFHGSRSGHHRFSSRGSHPAHTFRRIME